MTSCSCWETAMIIISYTYAVKHCARGGQQCRFHFYRSNAGADRDENGGGGEWHRIYKKKSRNSVWYKGIPTPPKSHQSISALAILFLCIYMLFLEFLNWVMHQTGYTLRKIIQVLVKQIYRQLTIILAFFTQFYYDNNNIVITLIYILIYQ